MYSSPVRHWNPKIPVRLACIRHAASVHPEPGSNSPSSHGEHLALSIACILPNVFSCLSDVFLFSYQCSAASLSGLLAYSTTLLRPLQGFFSKK